MVQRAFPIIAAIAFSAVVSSASYAGEQTYSVGVSADITGGAAGPDISGVSLSQGPEQYAAYYGSYPSVSFKGRGEHTSLNSSYAFGFNKYNSNPDIRTQSHTANLGFSGALSPKWGLNLSDSFSISSDITSYLLLSREDLTAIPDEFRYIFNPVVASSIRSNYASVGLDHPVSQRSSLNFGFSHSLINYGGRQQLNGVLSDQQRFSANMGYSQTGEHSSRSLGYSIVRFNLNSFQNALSHSVSIGYSQQFSPAVSISLSVGPSYLQAHNGVKHHVSVNATFSVHKAVQRGSFSLWISHLGNDTSGASSVTSNDQFGLAISRKIGRKTNFSSDISAFNASAKTLASNSSRGVSASASVGFDLARMWSINWGGQYQRYLGTTSLDIFEQKRIFMSLRYNNPELWRFQR